MIAIRESDVPPGWRPLLRAAKVPLRAARALLRAAKTPLRGAKTAVLGTAHLIADKVRRRPHLSTPRPLIVVRDDTRVALEECGGVPRPFVKTYDYVGDTVSAYHASLATAPLGRLDVPVGIDIGIDGYLARAEAMKLYELAFFAPGDILELGTFCGLSTSILARARFDGGAGVIETCDINPLTNKRARTTVRRLPGGNRVRFHIDDAASFLDRMVAGKRRFALAFVDHWHGYEATRDALVRMPALLSPGGFLMLHDYNDPCARDPEHAHKVFQAATDTLGGDDRFRFVCVTASSAVFQFHPRAS